MGITKVFNNAAELSGISEETPLKLSKVSLSLVSIGQNVYRAAAQGEGTKGHIHTPIDRSLRNAIPLDSPALGYGQVTE